MNIAVIGANYSGIVISACFSEMGNKVFCVDADLTKINNLKKNNLSFFEPKLDEMIYNNQKNKNLIFTTSIHETLSKTKTIFIAETHNLNQIMVDLIDNMTHDSIIILKSIPPSNTYTNLKKQIETILKEKKLGLKIDIGYNPDFLKIGNAINDFMHPQNIIIGADTNEVIEILKEIYYPFLPNNPQFSLMSIEDAEMTSYVYNAMIACENSFMNEITTICELSDVNIEKIREGIGLDKRINYNVTYDGNGYEEEYSLKNLLKLIEISENRGYEPELLKKYSTFSELQENILFKKIVNRFGNAFTDKTFCVWGLSLKKNTDNVNNSTSTLIIPKIIKKGGKVKAYDPKASLNFINTIDSTYLESLEIVKDKFDALDDCECLIILTDWDEFIKPDFDIISEKLKQKIIFDGRNIFDEKIKNRGFELYQIGK